METGIGENLIPVRVVNTENEVKLNAKKGRCGQVVVACLPSFSPPSRTFSFSSSSSSLAPSLPFRFASSHSSYLILSLHYEQNNKPTSRPRRAASYS